MKSESLIGNLLSIAIRVAIVLGAIYLIYQGIIISYDYGYRIFQEPAMTEGEGRVVSVSISQDMSPINMGKMFESKGLIRDSKLFVLQYYCSEYRKDIKPGIYELSTSMTAEEMFAAMAADPEEEKDKEDA